jgi:uncharacterized protein (TIGR03032 family)
VRPSGRNGAGVGGARWGIGSTIAIGETKYATALGATDAPRGWNEGKESGGVLVDVKSGETIVAGLPMLHTPRVYDGQLYVLLSATGEVVTVDVPSAPHPV